MEFRYKREMNHNYLIITQVTDGAQGYQMKMLLNNQIEGLLKFRMKLTDLIPEYYYEISSKQPLSRLLENRSISGEEISKLLLSISSTLKRSEAYLLEEQQILLNPEFIYMNTESFQAYLCCVPGYTEDFPAEFRTLLQYLLGKINHQDKQGVVLAYGLYQESLKENYGMEDLLKLLYEGNKAETKKPQTDYEELRNRSLKQEETANKSVKIEQIKTSIHTNPMLNQWRNVLAGVSIFSMVFVFLAPLIVWITSGKYNVQNNIIIFIGADVLIAIIGGYILTKLCSKQQSMEPAISFMEEEDEELDRTGIEWLETPPIKEELSDKTSKLFSSDNGEHTTLLSELNSNKGEAAIRRLKSINKELGEEIIITHYPFTLGKSKGIADYSLSYAAVSRLHLKINKISEGYTITDLNSTNGTKVGSYQLEANETIPLMIGDDISIAGLDFRFS